MYCRHCGNEILNATIICPKCGCANTPKQEAAAPVSYDNRNTYKNGFKEYALMALIFGGCMSLFIGIASLSFPVGILAGLLCGILFSLIMFLFVRSQENKFSKMRNNIAQTKTVICDGGATINGNGGWLFFTDKGLEFHAHEVNFDTRSIIIPIENIKSIDAKYNRITIYMYDQNSFKFVVTHADKWKFKINSHIAQTYGI